MDEGRDKATDAEVEAASRAICVALHIDPDSPGWVERYLPMGKAWMLYSRHARAVLEMPPRPVRDA